MTELPHGGIPTRYPGSLSKDHGYLNKDLVRAEFPHLDVWKKEWTARTGRDMSYAVFAAAGPKDMSHLGFYVHFQETDWIVHRPAEGPVETPVVHPDPGTHLRSAAAVPTEAIAERDWSKNFSDEIVTAAGTVTRPELAKTTVIKSVTDRMTAPLARLVAAGAAPHLDPTLVDHLGDGNYVIVLRNPEHPSMGGQLLHREEIDTRNPLHTPDRLVSMDGPTVERLLREMAVSEMIMAWAHDSNGVNVRSLAIQEAASAEFGLLRTREWPMTDGLRDRVTQEVAGHGEVHRQLLRIQYELTQEALSRIGVNNLVLYRGYSWPVNERPDWSTQPAGAVLEMPAQRPLSAWTGDRQIAVDWLSGREQAAIILAARMPRESILAFPQTGIGCLWQREFVLLAGGGWVTLDMVHDVGPARAGEEGA